MGRRSSKRGAASAALGEHLSAVRSCEKSGESLKSYAERHGVSVHALYQAKKTARKKGLLPPYRATSPAGSRAKPTRRTRFVEVRSTASAPPPVRSTWRIRFASGEVLESDAALSVDDIARLAEQFRRQL